MRITGAKVFGADRQFHERDILIRDGLITDDEYGGETIDARGCYAIPGLIDIHFHGALGADFCDGKHEAFVKIAEYELSRGITAICPATLTLPVSQLNEILSVGAEVAMEEREGIADIIGFNMEGPFISRAKKGAQNEHYIRKCDTGIIDEFIASSKGLLKITGLAPEENPGFEEYIKEVMDKVKVSLAHTACDYETAMRAFDAGASHVVHLYNAMTGLHHRQPGLVGAAADRKSVTAELICDGVHVHPAVVRNTFKMLGDERVVMISDSLRCAGMPDGLYDLGGQEVEKKGRFCRLTEDGNIAGSASDLMDCMVRAVKEMEIPLEIAVAASTINPARVIGADDRYGSLEPGRFADIVLLDKNDLMIKQVFKRGKKS